ncbi:MAG: cysteine hydrolase [Candidatus Bipolaricaulis sp.]|nr:cysteine hydrolase [Candidatus Bipolaricaulis sp.]
MCGSAKSAARARTALVIVDMQNDFVSPAGAMARFGFHAADVQAIVAPLAALLDAARRNGVAVFHTRMVNDVRRNAPSWTAFWGEPAVTLPGSWGAEFVPELTPLPTETVVEKYGYGAFFGTSLDTMLRACGVDTIAVAGTGPNICSGDTMHQAFALGYHVVAVSDCLACFSRRGAAHSATMKDVGLYVIENHYGRVVTSRDLIAAWEGDR